LEQSLSDLERDSSTRDAFRSLPFWTSEYVGAGPYRLERWDRGIEMAGSAFAGHALGRPKIDRLIYRYIPDENTALANILAGEAQYGSRTTLRFDQAQILKREWASAGKGSLLSESDSLVYHLPQFRPEYQRTPA